MRGRETATSLSSDWLLQSSEEAVVVSSSVWLAGWLAIFELLRVAILSLSFLSFLLSLRLEETKCVPRADIVTLSFAPFVDFLYL